MWSLYLLHCTFFVFITLYFWPCCIGLYAVQSAMQQCPDSLPELLFLIWSRRQSLGRNWRPLPFSGALLLLFQRFTFSQSGGLINWAGPIRECFLLEQSQRIDYNGKSRWFYRPTICHALISNEALDLKSGCVWRGWTFWSPLFHIWSTGHPAPRCGHVCVSSHYLEVGFNL